jgi:PH (Pleckstrin Homology) domain-containing protein
MKCRECGAEYDEHSVYCPKCGERTDEAPPSPVADEAPPTEEPAASPGPEAGRDSAEPEGEVRRTVSDRLRDTAKLHHDAPDDPAMKPANPWTEGGYSGKAMRGHFILAWAVTVLFLGFGIWLSFTNRMPGDFWTKIIWGLLALMPAAFWCWLGCAYIYRVWTIKYRLVTYRFYHEEGIFRRVKDVIEVIDIDDIKLERTLWDRIVNGGVGTVIIGSSDASHPELKLRGLEEPERVFESIDEVRRKQRVERGLKAI